MADALGLSDLMGRPVDELSGGQRQRAFLGRCLAQQPSALLLDEPNTYLDLRHQVELCQRLRRLAADRHLGVLMAVHDLTLAGLFADRVVLLAAAAWRPKGRLMPCSRPPPSPQPTACHSSALKGPAADRCSSPT